MTKRIESQYQHGGAVYYFETDDNSVKILDKDNKEIGTLNQLAFNGKPVTGGDFKDLTHTGIYKVRGLTGLPDNVPADEECMLAVQAIGPNLKLYRLITPKGIIVENTVSGGTQSGWGAGGVELRNTIDNINRSLGAIQDLKTKSKNLSSAVNELFDNMYAFRAKNHERLTELEGKNFDSRYLPQTGGKINGSITIDNGYAYNLETSKGLTANLGYMDSEDTIHLGSEKYSMKITGAGTLVYNGATVLTSDNAGSFGLDADKLGGLGSSDFIRVNGNDTKNGQLRLNKSRLDFKLKDGDYAATGITFTNDDGKVMSQIMVSDIGDILFNPGGKEFTKSPFTFDQLRNLVQYGGGHYIRSVEPTFMFQTWDEETGKYDNGVGFYKPAWDKGSLIVNNANTGDIVARFAYGSNHESVKLTHAPYIGEQGSRLFIQNERPTGDIPYGSVWIGL